MRCVWSSDTGAPTAASDSGHVLGEVAASAKEVVASHLTGYRSISCSESSLFHLFWLLAVVVHRPASRLALAGQLGIVAPFVRCPGTFSARRLPRLLRSPHRVGACAAARPLCVLGGAVSARSAA